MALEVRESFPEDDVEVGGVVLEETEMEEGEIKVTTVIIEDERGQKAMGKPIGTYITIESPYLSADDEEGQKAVAKEIRKQLDELSGGLGDKGVLVAGLGNREATPDALGPMVVDGLLVTRHLIKEFGQEFVDEHGLRNVSAISPGVMAQTGMESREILSAIVQKTGPDLVIVVDALAARSIHRLGKTIQITNTGICPGSGVGNNRMELNQNSLGVPVIAFGVPTVVDAATIIGDGMEDFMRRQNFSDDEIGGFLSDMETPAMRDFFVTPKNVDEAVRQMCQTIVAALNG